MSDRTNTTTTQESNMTIDIDTIPDAELGALLKKTMREDMARALPALRNKAKWLDEQAAAQDVEQTTVDRKANRKVLGAFTVGDIEVPALDLRDLTDLNVVVPAAVRSPYNKARKALTQEGPLDKEVTYARLEAEHKILRRFAKETAKVTVVAADLSPEQEAQVATLVKAGWKKKDAKALVKGLVTA